MSTAELLALDADAEEEYYSGLSDEAWLALGYDWEWWARPKQKLPSPLPYIVMFQTGRGFGKTRGCAEATRERAESGKSRRMGVLTPTAAVARDVVVEGESGLINCAPPWCKPVYNQSKKRVTWPNGVQLQLFSSEEPELIRGAELDWLWIEEACALSNPKKCFSNAFFALRLGRDPHCIISTTPKRRHYILEKIREIKKKTPSKVFVIRGHTLENKSNLADESLEIMVDTFGDTRLGKQELEGEELLDVPGAFWSESQLEKLRVSTYPTLKRIWAGVDPAVSSNKRSDENGIVVAARGVDDHLYVLGDYSIHGTSGDWARALFRACVDWAVAGIAVETCRGGNLVRRNLELTWKEINEERERDGLEPVVIPFIKEINSQELDKMGRVELFSGLWEQGRAHSVGNLGPKYPRKDKPDQCLEGEMCSWSPEESKFSPNRIDALIEATSKLFPEREQIKEHTMSKRIEVDVTASVAPRRVSGAVAPRRKSRV